MLKPDYLKGLPDNIQDIFLELEDEIIADISRRISKGLELTETADYQINQLKSMGYNLDDIEKRIAKATKLGEDEIERMLKESSNLSYENDKEAYKVGGKVLPKMPPSMNKFIIATIKQTKGELKNITNTLGFVDGGNFKDLSKFYKDTLDYATFQLGSGAYDYNTVLKQAVKKLADSGVRSIDYESGRSYHVDTAVRNAVMTANSQITGRISEINADMVGQDLMEITSHIGSRPDHKFFQSKIVSRSGRRGYLSLSDIGYEEGWGFKSYGCRHDWFPYFEGISTPAKKAVDPPDFKYEGKTYTAYEASQKQRYIERQIRKTKRELIAYENAGLKDDFTNASIKLRRQRDFYKDFSKNANLREKVDRTGVYGYNRSISSKSVWADRKARQSVTRSQPNIGTRVKYIDRRKLSVTEVRKELDKVYLNEYGKTLSKRNIRSIEDYQIKTYIPYNKYLRGRSGSLSDKDLEVLDILRETTRKVAIKEDMVLSRGTTINALEGLNWDDLEVGETLTEKAFMSVSVREETAKKFAKKKKERGILMDIEVKKGSKAVFVDTAVDYNWESEFIFPPGTKLKVLEKWEDKGLKRIKGMIVDD